MNHMKEILIGVVYGFLVYLFSRLMNYLESFSEVFMYLFLALLFIPLYYISKYYLKKNALIKTRTMGVSY
jgi:hypothetical protein